MDDPIRAALCSLRSLSDLPALVDAIGHEPLWRELPDRHWQVAGIRSSALVGRHGDFWWHAIDSAVPERTAPRVARALRQAGELAGILAFDPARRVLAWTVSLDHARARLLRLDAPDDLDLACLSRIASPGESTFGTAARAADALGGEAAGDRFFRRFQSVLRRFQDAFPAQAPPATRHELALLQLTRVLFLYFVQAKGWLDGRPQFLGEEVDRCLSLGRCLHRDLLRPLFFGTLNRPLASRRGSTRQFGAIPFLNGGLFASHPIERDWSVDLPNPLWQSAFADLFEHFHFVPRHGGTRQAIDPDMLGRVFESVMDPDARRTSGTFFTPPDLARALLREGLIAVLASRLRLGTEMAARRLDDPDPLARGILDRVTILDPAVGSGVFLVSALDLLAGLPIRNGSAAGRRRHVLRHSLFGVDRNPSAVRLAELRLWLELLAADDADRPDRVEPLPNLDSLVRQGDSLLDPMGVPIQRWLDPSDAAAIADARRLLVTSPGPSKRGATRALRAAEVKALGRAVERGLASVAERLGDLAAHAGGRTLFGDRAHLSRHQRDAGTALRNERRRLRDIARALRETGALPWFHYPVQFADVFTRGGFDLVVGNPPWVRAEALPKALRLHLAERYRWWRPGGSRGFSHQPDVSIAFLEKACGLAGQGGTVAFLLPAKVATADYAAPARDALARGTTVHVAADLARDRRAVFEATVYPYALVASMMAPPPAHRVRGALGAPQPAVPQSRLGRAPWVIVPEPLERARQRAREGHPRLDTIFSCHLGVKTGLNHVFLAPPADVEPECVRPAIRGRDVAPHRCDGGVRLLWPCTDDGAALPFLPPQTSAYLAPHAEALRRRRDWTGGPWWTLFRTGPACAPHRVVWPDLARQLRAVLLDTPAVPLNSCYLLTPPSADAALCLVAWLNAPPIRALARLGADPAASHFRRYNARTVGALPLPPEATRCTDLQALARRAATGSDVADELAETASRHLGLTPEDRRALGSVLE